MTEPVRVQLSRKKGWRMPENTVSVARPGPRGNCFVVTDKVSPGKRVGGARYIAVPTVEDAVACFREMFDLPGETADAYRAMLPELRGKNIGCWCALDAPCHGDVWLELANARTHPTELNMPRAAALSPPQPKEAK